MPRAQPWPGYITATEAIHRLNISDSMLSRYVRENRLRRYGPTDRKHKWYKESEVNAILAAREIIPEPVSGPTRYLSYPSLASAADMPAIVEISRLTFNVDQQGRPKGKPIPAEVRMAWLSKNPETFWVVRRPDGAIVGFASILPLRGRVIDGFIKGEISAEEISAEDVDLYVATAHPKHLYIMAIAIDPQYPALAKHSYGARLLGHIFDFLLRLAERGIAIGTITARSRLPDGIRLLRKMGIPQVKPWVPGMALFQVEVARSGLPLFVEYQARLAAYNAAHPTPIDPGTPISPLALPQRRAARHSSPRSADNLSEGLEVTSVFAQRHFPIEPGEDLRQYSNRTARLTQTLRESGRVPMVAGEYKVGQGTARWALDASGRRSFWEHAHDREGFQSCLECPHEV